MSKIKPGVRYDFNYLQHYCKDNGIILLKDYSNINVNIYTVIEGICVNCQNIFQKGMKPLCINGGMCKKCGIKLRMDKIKQTMLEKYGVEHALQNKKIIEKVKQHNLTTYGVENQFQSEKVKDKIKKTNLLKYGFEYPMQNREIREKTNQTNLVKYGVENPSQNSEVAEKASKNAYLSKAFTFPSGRIEKIQGYEHFMLNELLQQNIAEDDIIISRKDVPTIWYKDTNNKKRRYFVDCFIKSQNKCIETKSTWTAEKKKDCIFLKQQAVKDNGYKCEIWVYNSKGEKIECYK